jgi:glycerol-3-phosphate dehydrogenase
MADYDLAVIGGGIHGCGIARDAAGRGLSVLLVEQSDLGGATSSASTKLIHGGLRYLEQFSFRLVRESLRERERLLRLAPHLVRPMRFVAPHQRGGRPAWLVRLGLLLYDGLAGRTALAPSRHLDLADDPAGVPLKRDLRTAFEYSDCVVDDARLVIANAVDARERGAVIRPRTRLIAARREDRRWQLVLHSVAGRETASARALINATGPWAGHVLTGVIRRPSATRLRLVKGSHMVVPRIAAHDRAYVFENDDGRVVFAIPYGDAFTLIGTTEVDVEGEPSRPVASADEILYLCRAASALFRAPVEPSSLRWAFSGVRPLIGDSSEAAFNVTREYKIEVDGPYGEAPLLTVFGGKLTTYRPLAEQAVSRLGHWFVLGRRWTAEASLPGGDLGAGGVDALAGHLRIEYPFLAEPHALRLARAYGTRSRRILSIAEKTEDLGPRLVGDLYQAELDYLRREEWVETAEDVLWRRTKLGLVASAAEVAELTAALGMAAERAPA